MITKATYNEDAVRAVAHQIWEEEGRPTGRHDIHWQSALERVQLAPLTVKAPRAKVDQTKAAKKK